jgi:hypothetical protein
MIALLGASISVLPNVILRSQTAGESKSDPHRPSCRTPDCRKIRSFLISSYCGDSPFGNGPDDSCAIKHLKHPKPSIDVIAQSSCAWNETLQKNVCKQCGQAPPQIRAILIRQLRRLGLPAIDDERATFTIWKSRPSGWSVAEASDTSSAGSAFAFCQVIIMIDPSSQVSVVREVRRQQIDEAVPKITTWVSP